MLGTLDFSGSEHALCSLEFFLEHKPCAGVQAVDSGIQDSLQISNLGYYTKKCAGIFEISKHFT